MSICIDLENESCNDLAQKLNIMKKDMVLIIVGEMSIEYTGRASSYAQTGPRLLIIKPDGSLLVHEHSQVEPLNWQPPKSVAYFECYGDRLRVRSLRENPREEVIVELSELELVKACKLTYTKLTVIGRESDVIKIILENPSVIEDGAVVVGFDVPTSYGKIDVLLRKDDKFIVVEVKNEKAGIPAVVQLKRYVEFYINQGHKVEGVLVAPDISRDAKAMLIRERFKFIDFTTLKREDLAGKTLEKFFKISKK